MSANIPYIFPALCVDKAQPAGPLQYVPFGPVSTNLFLVQECSQDAREWAPMAIGTPYRMGGVSLPGFYLTEESEARHQSHLRTWTRIYMPVFPSWDDYEMATLPDVPGLGGGSGAGSVKSFVRNTQAVSFPSKVTNSFFQLGVSRSDDGVGTLIQYPDQIPQWNRLPIFISSTESLDGWSSSYSGAIAVSLSDHYDRPAWFPDAISGLTLTETQYWDNKVLAGAWMVWGDTRIERVRGNLYTRKTRYWKAQ